MNDYPRPSDATLPPDWSTLAASGSSAAQSAALQAVLGAYIAELTDLRQIAHDLTIQIQRFTSNLDSSDKPQPKPKDIATIVELRLTTSLKLNQTADRIVKLASTIESKPHSSSTPSFAPGQSLLEASEHLVNKETAHSQS